MPLSIAVTKLFFLSPVNYLILYKLSALITRVMWMPEWPQWPPPSPTPSVWPRPHPQEAQIRPLVRSESIISISQRQVSDRRPQRLSMPIRFYGTGPSPEMESPSAAYNRNCSLSSWTLATWNIWRTGMRLDVFCFIFYFTRFLLRRIFLEKLFSLTIKKH